MLTLTGWCVRLWLRPQHSAPSSSAQLSVGRLKFSSALSSLNCVTFTATIAVHLCGVRYVAASTLSVIQGMLKIKVKDGEVRV